MRTIEDGQFMIPLYFSMSLGVVTVSPSHLMVFSAESVEIREIFMLSMLKLCSDPYCPLMLSCKSPDEGWGTSYERRK